jgi:hypothetical protein
MNDSVIFLDYHGPVDLQVMESLITRLKKSREFARLNKTTGKRTYNLFVECIENIYKYSELKSSEDRNMQPHISVIKENDKIIITAGNTVMQDAREKLTLKLDKIKNSDASKLRIMHENRMNSDSRPGENGAGLGFISMAIKSGNNIDYSFHPLTDGYLYFEIKISINKYIMRKLIIEETPNSPKVILDPEMKIYQISGESRPPDVREFYDQILTWLDDFTIHLTKSDNKSEPIRFSFDFGYFNSSSGKLILDICKVLARLRAKEMDVIINWHYEKDDVDMLETGQEISRIIKFPFEYTETEAK